MPSAPGLLAFVVHVLPDKVPRPGLGVSFLAMLKLLAFVACTQGSQVTPLPLLAFCWICACRGFWNLISSGDGDAGWNAPENRPFCGEVHHSAVVRPGTLGVCHAPCSTSLWLRGHLGGLLLLTPLLQAGVASASLWLTASWLSTDWLDTKWKEFLKPKITVVEVRPFLHGDSIKTPAKVFSLVSTNGGGLQVGASEQTQLRRIFCETLSWTSLTPPISD